MRSWSGSPGLSPSPAERSPGPPAARRPRTGAAERWFPAGAEAYACLRMVSARAPLFVAWDRAGAPAAHRRLLLARWAEFWESSGLWGRGGAPPVLVAAAGPDELGQWGEAARARAEAAGVALPLLLTTVAELEVSGASGAIWRTPDARDPAPLAERLYWRRPGTLPAGIEPPAWPRDPAAPPRLRAREAPLRRRAVWARDRGMPIETHVERNALLTLATGAVEKGVAELVGRHPLLDREQLATLVDLPDYLALRCIERLRMLGVIAHAGREEAGEPGSSPRFRLTARGLRWLAARDRVPLGRYVKYGSHFGLSGSGRGPAIRRPGSPLWDVEHTVGVNRLFVGFALEARAAGARLAAWRTEVEATRRWVLPDGRDAWVRPDGAGVLVSGRDVCSFLIEYERGTGNKRDFRAKLQGYRHYFETEEWRSDFPSEPALLLACGVYGIEPRRARWAQEVSSGEELLLSAEWRCEWKGVLGPVWSTRAAPEEHDTLFRRNAALAAATIPAATGTGTGTEDRGAPGDADPRLVQA